MTSVVHTAYAGRKGRLVLDTKDPDLMPRQECQPLHRSRKLVVFGLGASMLLLGLARWYYLGGAQPIASVPSLSVSPDSRVIPATAEAAIVEFCGDCHALPRPESFPRQQWYAEVRLGYEAYARSGRNDLKPPLIQDTVAFYQSRAPEQLEFPVPAAVNDERRSGFTQEPLDWGQGNYILPAVSFLRWEPGGLGQGPRLLACDMRDGSVSSLEFQGAARRRTRLAQLNHPCHVEPCDLDADGLTDLVVAELGSFYPTDHDRGRVIWLRRNDERESFSPITIAEGLGRVADVRPADVDGDGDEDLIVAEFGHFRTGNIVLLRNTSAPGMPPRFVSEEIDPRPGTIHVPVHDFNSDGQPDFVALVSQEYEALDLFVNQGDGNFRLQNLWAGPDLTFGSSGIELVDLDQDGDTDILYTNGDSFDNSYASPTHGIQWLENVGDLAFNYHRLADLLGAYRALPADLDLDGDLDVIAVAFVPPGVTPKSLRSSTTASILVLEHTSPGSYTAHTLEAGQADHATVETGDLDADGDIDFVVGTHLFPHGVTPGVPTPARLTVWWNQQIANVR